MARLSVQKTVQWTVFCETQVRDRIEICGLYRADICHGPAARQRRAASPLGQVSGSGVNSINKTLSRLLYRGKAGSARAGKVSGHTVTRNSAGVTSEKNVSGAGIYGPGCGILV